jgi:hypothetical protein
VRCSGRVRACACLENWVAAGAKLNHNRLLLAQYRNNGNTNLKLNLFPFVNVNCATAGSGSAREREQGGVSGSEVYIHPTLTHFLPSKNQLSCSFYDRNLSKALIELYPPPRRLAAGAL